MGVVKNDSTETPRHMGGRLVEETAMLRHEQNLSLWCEGCSVAVENMEYVLARQHSE